MAINRVDYPANLTAQADFSAHGELIETRFMDQVNAPQWVVSGNIPQGVVLQIGGVVYRADSDTAITGTASDYVKITPSGATAAAAYVASLTGVSWSAQYNGYYDASENLYLFDEGKALKDSPAITALLTRYVTRTEDGDTYIGRDLDVERNLTVGGTLGVTGDISSKAVIEQGVSAVLRMKVIQIGSWNMDATSEVTIATGVTASDIRTATAIILLDDAETGASEYSFDISYVPIAGTQPGGAIAISKTNQVVLRRTNAGFFDSAQFDSTTAPSNRGWITIWYED